jgi:hypothetical protein
MVCLENRGGPRPVAVDYAVTVANGGSMFTEVDTNSFSTITFLSQEQPIQVFSVVRDVTTRERDAYVLTNRGRVINVFTPSVTSPETAKLLIGSELISEAQVMQSCGTSGPTLLVRVQDPTPPVGAGFQEMKTMSADGDGLLTSYHSLKLPLAGPEKLAINNTGCVAELRPDEDPILRQVGVVDVTFRNSMLETRSSTAAHFSCDVQPSRECTAQFAVPRVGVGFLAADDPTSDENADPQKRPERMVSATFDASGTVLSVTVLQPGNDGPRPVEVERVTSAAFPSHLVSGQFDGDGQADLFWDIQNNISSSTNFQLAYGRKVGTARLSALSATQQDMIVIDTEVADVTDDGVEDLIIMSADSLVLPSVFQVRVIPAQAPIKDPGFAADKKCMPSNSP